MLPMVFDWLIKSALAAILLVVIIVLMLVPARHVLVPLWPWPVDEVLLIDPAGNSGQREFVSGLEQDKRHRPVISRDRPMTLVALEIADGGIKHGFLVGVRPEPETALLENIPENLVGNRSGGTSQPNLVLVLMRADESRVELMLADVYRIYHPNQLSLLDRLVLTSQRLLEAWRWP